MHIGRSDLRDRLPIAIRRSANDTHITAGLFSVDRVISPILTTELTARSGGGIAQGSEYAVVACGRISPGNLLADARRPHLTQGYLRLLAIPLVNHCSRYRAREKTRSSPDQCALPAPSGC